MTNLASSKIGVAAVLAGAGGVYYLARSFLHKDDALEDDSDCEDSYYEDSSSDEDVLFSGPVLSARPAKNADLCKKQKKVRFADDVVSPRGNNQEWRSRMLSMSKKGSNMSSQSTNQCKKKGSEGSSSSSNQSAEKNSEKAAPAPAPAVMRSGLDKTSRMEALVGSKVPGNRIPLYNHMYHSRRAMY